MSQPIRILLADDHVMLRQGTAEILSKEADIEVVGEADNGQQAIDLTLRLRPDIVVMDVRMPVLSGIEATRRIREDYARSTGFGINCLR
jgi:DNA-binding NarL/FixJ family response regulator